MIAYEWHALRTLKHTRVVLLTVGMIVLVGSAATSALFGMVSAFGLSADGLLVALLRLDFAATIGVTILAVATTMADMRRGLALPAILRAGSRERVWLAKLAVAMLSAVVLALASAAVAVIAVAWAKGMPTSGAVVGYTGRWVLYVLGWAAMGVGLSSMVKHPLGSVAIPVAIANLVEPIVMTSTAFAPGLHWIRGVMPFNAGAEFIVGSHSSGLYMAPDHLWQATVVFFGLVCAVLAAGFQTIRRSELVPADAA